VPRRMKAFPVSGAEIKWFREISCIGELDTGGQNLVHWLQEIKGEKTLGEVSFRNGEREASQKRKKKRYFDA